jgi:cysteine desulfurase/selenocysteine lyase
MEHHSNIIPWFLIRDKYKCKILFANIDSTGNIDQKHFESLISEKTKLVSITHLSNVFGTIVNQEIIKICNKASIPILLDGCQSASHIPIDVKTLGCDYYVFSGHKLYAPTGVGVFYGKENLIEELPPYQGGGGMIADVSTDGATFTDLPAKFEAGTPPLVEAYGLGIAIDYVNELGMSEISEHEFRLTNYALNKMQELDFVDIHGANENKHSIISFNIKNVHSHEVSSFLDVEGIAIRAGHHCCQPLMKHLNLNSTARLSFGMYNTEDEIDIFINALKNCRDFFIK